MVKTFSLNPVEAQRLSELLLNQQRAEQDLRVGLTMLLAHYEITEATFHSLNGQELQVQVPD